MGRFDFDLPDEFDEFLDGNLTGVAAVADVSLYEQYLGTILLRL